jgi:methionyl-tRNA synthetase
MWIKDALAQIVSLKADVEKKPRHLPFPRSSENAMDMARLGNKYLADMEPWKVVKTDEERVKTIMNTCFQIAATSPSCLRIPAQHHEQAARLPQHGTPQLE